MDFKVFLAMAVLAYSATEVIKGVINVYAPQLKIGLALALVLGLLFDLGYGIGLVSAISGIQYVDVFIPQLFMGIDIFTTGCVLSLGSKGLNAILEHFGVDIAGSLQVAIDKYMKEQETKE